MERSSALNSSWGVDIGGTTTVVGYLDGDGSFITVAVLPTRSHEEPGLLLSRIAATVHAQDPRPASMGLGVAGFVDCRERLLITSPNLPMMVNIPLGKRLEELIGCPVTIENDCNAFAAGAVAGGQIPAKGLWLLITLGTGIGGAIVLDGTVEHGRGFAGEFGHMTIVADGIACPCGNRGCWERYASAGALLRYCTEAGSPEGLVEPKEAASLADGGDRAALTGFSRLGRWVGVGLSNLSWCFSPDGIALAGGLSNAWRHFSREAEEEHRRRCPFPWTAGVLRHCSETGAWGAAVIGKSFR
jgi:glucokinase